MMGMKRPRPIDPPTYHLSRSTSLINDSFPTRFTQVVGVQRQVGVYLLTSFIGVHTEADDQHQVDGNACAEVIDPAERNQHWI